MSFTKISDKNSLYHVVFVDISGDTQGEAISCPLPAFITEHALTTMRDTLVDNGTFNENLCKVTVRKGRLMYVYVEINEINEARARMTT